MENEIVIDATGLRCPLPVIRLEAALRRLPFGGRVRILADDPVAAVDIPHFVREAGWRCERAPGPEGICVFQVTQAEKP